MSPLSTTPTMNHEKASLISDLTTPAEIVEEGQASEEREDNEEQDEFTAGPNTVVGGSSLASHALSEESSDYFKPNSKVQRQHQNHQEQLQPTHQSNDSLCYSTDNDFDINTIGSVSTISYLGSVVRSLDVQQAFPSSMFPGQKLISPSSSRETVAVTPPINEGGGTTDPYYYYTTSSFYKDSYQNSGGGGVLRRPGSTPSPNVYQKRHKGLFWSDYEDDDDFHESELDPSCKRCWRCFFSPRVVVTLTVCAIILINLLQMGHRYHHHHNQYIPLSSVNKSNTDYVQLEAIRGSGNNNFFNGSISNSRSHTNSTLLPEAGGDDRNDYSRNASIVESDANEQAAGNRLRRR